MLTVNPTIQGAITKQAESEHGIYWFILSCKPCLYDLIMVLNSRGLGLNSIKCFPSSRLYDVHCPSFLGVVLSSFHCTSVQPMCLSLFLLPVCACLKLLFDPIGGYVHLDFLQDKSASGFCCLCFHGVMPFNKPHSHSGHFQGIPSSGLITRNPCGIPVGFLITYYITLLLYNSRWPHHSKLTNENPGTSTRLCLPGITGAIQHLFMALSGLLLAANNWTCMCLASNKFLTIISVHWPDSTP